MRVSYRGGGDVVLRDQVTDQVDDEKDEKVCQLHGE